jgi:hypothetical protein
VKETPGEPSAGRWRARQAGREGMPAEKKRGAFFDDKRKKKRKREHKKKKKEKKKKGLIFDFSTFFFSHKN